MKKISKTIKLSPTVEIIATNIQQGKLLVLNYKKQSKYISIPSFIGFNKNEDTLFLNLETNNFENISALNRIHSLLLNCLNTFEKPFKKKLLLKGLGFRVGASEDSKVLDFKLGYSHNIKIFVPTEHIKVSVDKNHLTVEGFDKILVGNFSNQIRNLKYPDSYKGKGFWYKDEIKVLKEIKKT